MKSLILLFATFVSGLVLASEKCRAQDVLKRLEEFSSHSFIFDVPSILHFDITIIQDGEKSGLSLRKIIGRFVQGERLGFRIDLQEMGDNELGRESERQHFLSMPNGERFLASERPSYGFNSIVIDPTITKTVNTMVSKGNPFRYIIKGCQSLHTNPDVDVFGAIQKNYEELGVASSIRAKAAPTVIQVEFDEDTPWQINRMRALIPEDRKQFALMLKNKTGVDSIEKTKKWLCARDTRAKWREIDGIGPVPYWIHSVQQGLRGDDPKFAEQMEAFFFGFQFDNIPLERYFDKSRFTEKLLKDDFKLSEIQSLKEQEQKK